MPDELRSPENFVIDADDLVRSIAAQIYHLGNAADKAAMLERLREDMPMLHKRVVIRMRELAASDTGPPKDPVPPPADKPRDPATPVGRPGKFLLFFQGLMGTLKGGGVWAALTLALCVCGWLGWELKASQDRLYEVLLAVKLGGSIEPPAGAATRPALAEAVFNPNAVLLREYRSWKPQVTQMEQRQLPDVLDVLQASKGKN